jgi:hypothetical protein
MESDLEVRLRVTVSLFQNGTGQIEIGVEIIATFQSHPVSVLCLTQSHSRSNLKVCWPPSAKQRVHFVSAGQDFPQQRSFRAADCPGEVTPRN